MKRAVFEVIATSALLIASRASASNFDPAPWIADLEQARAAFHEKYANWDWVETEHEVKIDPLFDESAKRILKAADGEEAKAVFERIVMKLGDGHVGFDWPDPPRQTSSNQPPKEPDMCSGLGYETRQNAPGVAQALPGYAPLQGSDNPIAAGVVNSGRMSVGILRIGVFQPQGFPDLCRAASRALKLAPDRPCDDRCADRITGWAYERLTASLEERLRQLKAAKVRALIVDVTKNGGGSEWAEAVARMLTPKLLHSERRGFVRGEHWAAQWRDLGERLRSSAATASPSDRKQLLTWAAETDEARLAAEKPCLGSATCERIVTGGFSTEVVGAAPAGVLSGREWSPYVFSPSQYDYRDGEWDGPLIVLVDQNTWSAAEEFAAVLQDNGAAIIMGARTGGAGCGYTNGGTPTKLANSGAILRLPDCVRYRADGSNEVRGILPDVVVPIRKDDGTKFRAQVIAAKLPEALALAHALFLAGASGRKVH